MRLYVYAVKVACGQRGRKRWPYSTPIEKADAEREANELRATGHEVVLMTASEAIAHKRKERCRG